MKAIGIVVYLMYGLWGLGILLFLTVTIFAGMTSGKAAQHNLFLYIGLLSGFILGIVYITPVLVFPRESWILGYIVAAVLATVFLNWCLPTNPNEVFIWNRFTDKFVMNSLMLAGPLFLAGIALFQNK